MLLLVRLLLVFLVVAAPIDDRKKKGREGNKQYNKREYAAAAQLFQAALASESEQNAVLSSRLANNLGCTLNRQEDFEQATRVLQQAVESATSPTDRTRAAYNAGNTAFQAQDPSSALAFYKQALLSDPANELARFNYEFVRRLLEQQSEQEQGEDSEQDDSDQEKQQNSDGEQQQEEQEPEQDEQAEPRDDPGEQEQEPQEQEREDEMTPEQAEQILQALQTDEEELMRQVWKMHGKAKKVDKDW